MKKFKQLLENLFQLKSMYLPKKTLMDNIDRFPLLKKQLEKMPNMFTIVQGRGFFENETLVVYYLMYDKNTIIQSHYDFYKQKINKDYVFLFLMEKANDYKGTSKFLDQILKEINFLYPNTTIVLQAYNVELIKVYEKYGFKLFDKNSGNLMILEK